MTQMSWSLMYPMTWLGRHEQHSRAQSSRVSRSRHGHTSLARLARWVGSLSNSYYRVQVRSIKYIIQYMGRAGVPRAHERSVGVALTVELCAHTSRLGAWQRPSASDREGTRMVNGTQRQQQPNVLSGAVGAPTLEIDTSRRRSYLPSEIAYDPRRRRSRPIPVTTVERLRRPGIRTLN